MSHTVKPPDFGLPETVSPEFLQKVADEYQRMLTFMDESGIEEPSTLSLGNVDANGKFILADPNEVDDDDINEDR